MFVMERLVAIMAPHRCLGCGDEGSVLCDWCLPDFVPPLPSRCYNCFVYSPDSRVCQKCRRTRRLRHVWVRAEYETNAKALVYACKFDGKRAAARQLAMLMSQSLPYLPPNTIVTHVPTASRRVRQRGFDHASLMARALARERGLSYQPLLRRITQTRQVGAKRSVRLRQMEHAFAARSGASLAKVPILLVDDLVTTGATLEAAAGTLRKAGARNVSAVVFAQKR